MRWRRTPADIPQQQMEDKHATALMMDAEIQERVTAEILRERERLAQEASEAERVQNILDPIDTALDDIRKCKDIDMDTLTRIENTPVPPPIISAVLEKIIDRHQEAYNRNDPAQAEGLYMLYAFIGRSDPVTTEHKLNTAQMLGSDTYGDQSDLRRIAEYKTQLEQQLGQLAPVALDRRASHQTARQASQEIGRIREVLKTVETDKKIIEQKIRSQLLLAAGCVRYVEQHRRAAQPKHHVETPKVNVQTVQDEQGNAHTLLVPENRSSISKKALATAGLAGTVLVTGAGPVAAEQKYPYTSSAATSVNVPGAVSQVVVSPASHRETVEMVEVKGVDGTPELIPASHAVRIQAARQVEQQAGQPVEAQPASATDIKDTISVEPASYQPSPAPSVAPAVQAESYVEDTTKATVEVQPSAYAEPIQPVAAAIPTPEQGSSSESEAVTQARQYGSAEALAAAYMDEAQAAGNTSVEYLDPNMQLFQQVSQYIRGQIEASQTMNLSDKQRMMLHEAAARAATIAKFPQTAASVGMIPTEGLSEEFLDVNSKMLINDVNAHGYNHGPGGVIYTDEQLQAVIRATSIVGALTIPPETQSQSVKAAKEDASTLEVVGSTDPDRYTMRTEEILPFEEAKDAPPAEVVKGSEQAAREQFAAFLAAIKEKESGNNFTIVNNDTPQRAAGAFQITTDTWDNYKGYPTADAAPPHIQYERAHMMFTAYSKKFNGDWKDMAMAWYAGPAFKDRGFNIHRRQVHNGKKYPSISDYGDHVLEYMNQFLSNPDSIPGVPGMPEHISNPAVAARKAAEAAAAAAAAQAPAPAPPAQAEAPATSGDIGELVKAGRLIDLGNNHTGYDKGRAFPLQLYAVAGVVSEGGESTPGSKYYIEGANGQLIVSSEIAAGVVRLVDHARTKGIELRAISSYRTMAHQQDLDRNDPGGMVAEPGFSNHQDGTAVDWLLGPLDKFPISKSAYDGINGGRPSRNNIAAAPSSPVWAYLNQYAWEIGGLKQLWFETWHFSKNGG